MRGKRVEYVLAEEAQLEELSLPADHFGLEPARKRDSPSRLRRLARADLGKRAARVEHALDQHLDFAAGVLAPAQPRLDDARVVHYEQVACVQPCDDVGESQVLDRARARIEVQQAARRALRRGTLGDQFGRQFVIEVGESHRSIIISRLTLSLGRGPGRGSAPGWRNW